MASPNISCHTWLLLPGLAGTGFILAENHLIGTTVSMQTLPARIRTKACNELLPDPLKRIRVVLGEIQNTVHGRKTQVNMSADEC